MLFVRCFEDVFDGAKYFCVTLFKESGNVSRESGNSAVNDRDDWKSVF